MPKPRLLVIDDDLMITKLLKDHFGDEGCEVTAAHFADVGYKMATQSPPDLIFLDVMLPDGTGFQTLGRLRDHSSTKEIPIIMMTGTARNANQIEISKGMGANDYVLKPFDIMDVDGRVKKLLNGKYAAAPPNAPVEATVETPAQTPESVVASPWAPMVEKVLNPVISEQAPEPALRNAAPTPPKTAPRPDENHPAEPTEEPGLTFTNIDSLIKPSHPLSDTSTMPVVPKDTPPIRSPLPEFDPPTVSRLPFFGKKPKEVVPEVPIETPVVALPTLEPEPVAPFASDPVAAGDPEPPAEPLVNTASRPAEKQAQWGLTLVLFFSYLGMTAYGTDHDLLRTLSFAAGGWALLVGYLVASAALWRISLSADQALQALGLASIPIVIRMGLGFAGLKINTTSLPLQDLWIRPLDLFEMAALLILGIYLRRLPRSSVLKSIGACTFIVLGWLLTSRGYFHPF